MSNIVLIGFMGVGKSTIGRQLAQLLSMEFIDTDELIEQQEGRTISTIFSEDGEAFFRELESGLLENQNFSNVVISSGGGMPCYHENMKRLKDIGRTIYLEISSEKLAERLWIGRKKRPLIKDVKTMDELINYIDAKLKGREEFYKEAEMTLDVNGKASCEILDELIHFVKNLK